MGDAVGNPYDQKGKGRSHQNGDVLALDLNSAEEGGNSRTSNGFMQMQLIEQQVTSQPSYLHALTSNPLSHFRIHIFNNGQQQSNLSNRQLPS